MKVIINMYCTQCGKNNTDSSKFCKYCGAKIEITPTDATTIKPELKKSTEKEEATKPGLHGWLAILGFALIYNTIARLISLNDTFTLLSTNLINVPGLAEMLYFEIFSSLIILSFLGYSLFLYFNKKAKFPKVYFGFMIGMIIYQILVYLFTLNIVAPTQEFQISLDESLSESISSIGGNIAYFIIWGTYIKKSKQVKATFIN